MNYTLMRAGRTTHLKIVVTALVAVIVVVAIGINARSDNVATARTPSDGTVAKVGHPSSYADKQASTIR